MISGIEFVIYGIVDYGGVIGMITMIARDKMPVSPEGSLLRCLFGLMSMTMLLSLAVMVGSETITIPQRVLDDGEITAGIIWYEQSIYNLYDEDLADADITYLYYATGVDYVYSNIDPYLWTLFHLLLAIMLMLWSFLNGFLVFQTIRNKRQL